MKPAAGITYITMLGVPVLMAAYLIDRILGLITMANIIMPLIAVGLIGYAVAGISEVYTQDMVRLGGSTQILGTRAHASARIRADAGEKVRVTIRRYVPHSGGMEEHSYLAYASKHTTVLDLLLWIRGTYDSTLSMRYSCRMGICGSCAMVINGKPSLACETNVLEHSRESAISIGPMEGQALLKDLVTDMSDFFLKHGSAMPYLQGEGVGERGAYGAGKPMRQSASQLNEYLPYSECIMCGLCLDACPVANANQRFAGPQALAQVYRYYKDSRDGAGARRLEYIDTPEGVWGCEFIGACSKVCPKGVDPAAAIQLLKGEIMREGIGSLLVKGGNNAGGER